MVWNLPLRKSDLRGGVRLVTDATVGVADLAEALHERIGRVPGRAAPAVPGRTSALTGLVYRAVRGVARGVGSGLEALVEELLPDFGPQVPVPRREAVIAALDGVLGDHLAATGNPLARPMTLRRDGRPLPMNREAAAESLSDAAPGVLVSIHGLCMNDLQWSRDGRARDGELAADLGLTLLRLDYNTGLHVAANGRDLADRLEALVDVWPRPLERIVLLGHSMGGLVARSACYWGEISGHRWPARVSDLVFFGTPHLGAPLEKAGHGVDLLLGAIPYASVFARLGKVRSAGIVDMRHGGPLDDGDDPRRSLPLPKGPRAWAVAASTAAEPGRVADAILGDGLVPVDSALGRHRDPARSLGFADDHTCVIRGLGHLELLWSDAVFARLRDWLGAAEDGASAAVDGSP